MTTVKEVLMTAAELIGEDGLKKSVGEGSSSSEELSLLLKCFNLVEDELALDYFPLKTCEKFAPADGKIAFTAFSEAPVRVLKVTDAEGGGLPFAVFFDRVEVHGSRGDVEVTYAFAPATKTLEGNSDFSGRVSARLIALGVATEYLLAVNRFGEAAAFEKKYREAIRAAGDPRRKLTARGRRWA